MAVPFCPCVTKSTFCTSGTTLSKKVESLETDLKQTKLTYGAAYTKLIKKVKKLENKVKSSQARRRVRIIGSDDEDDLEDPSKQGRKIAEIDQDPAILLVQHDAEIQGRHEHDMEFYFNLDDAAKDVSTTEKDVSTAKPISTTGAAVTTASVAVSTAKDKAELEKEERQRITRVHEEASSFNVEEWEDIQARVEANEELAQRRNKTPTQAQQRIYMSNYIKHMRGYTLQQLRGYSFDKIKNLFETTMRRVHTFVPIESEIERVIPELAVGSSKRDVEEELNQESSKRQKIGESSELAEEPKDKEEELSQEELQQMMIIVSEQGMNVEALQTKYPIIDWEIYTKGTRKDDLVMLWSLVKEKFNSTEPTNDKEREIWVELKRLFEPDTDDELWKIQKHNHDLTWRLYDSCGVHHVSTEKGIDIYMLVEKEYPLSKGTLTLMLVAKLLVDQYNKISRELLRKIFMQVHVSENSSKGNAWKDAGFWTKVLQYFESKTKAPGHRTYDMINGKGKTVRPNVARFCGVYANFMRRTQDSGAGDEDYYARALLDYEVEHGMSFTLRHYWEVLNVWDASINLNVDVGDDEEDEVQELRRLMSKDKVKGLKKKGPKLSGSSSCTNDEALARRAVECCERELTMQKYRQRQEDIMFYMHPYDHLSGDALNRMEALRAIKGRKLNRPRYKMAQGWDLVLNQVMRLILCTIKDMDIFPFIHTPNPTKVKIVEREQNEDEPLLLQTTVGRTVPLFLVVPDRAESELEASFDKLFNEGGSGNQTKQRGFTSSGGGADIQQVSKAMDTVAKDVAPLQPRHQKKRKIVVVGTVAGKSRSAIQRLLVGAVRNADVRGEAIPTLPFVTSSVSTTSEREGGDHTDSVAEVASLVRSFIPVMIVVTTVTSMVDPALVVKEKPVKPSLFFANSSLARGDDPNTGVFLNLSGSDFLWSVTNGSYLDDGCVYREMVDEFAPPKFFASVRGIEHDQLFTEFNVGVARQMSLSAEVRMRAEYNVKEGQRLKYVVEKQDEVLKVRERDIENLKAQLFLKEAEAAEAIRLRDEASNFKTVEKSLQDEVIALKEHNTILEKERNAVVVKTTDLEASVIGKERELTGLNAQLSSVKSQNDTLVDRVHELEISSSRLQEKVTLYTDFVEMALHLEEKFYLHLLTTISGRRWLLTHGMELAITKCLNSPEYLSVLGAAIGKAIDKGMKDGLYAGITHGKEGRVLTDVATYNPSAEVDYISALQQLQNVNFSLLAELKSNKDASIEAVMNVLRLEKPLADKLRLNNLQPHVDQLMVPIHHSPDKVVIGVTALSLALDVSSIRVQKIKENIANQRSLLHDVFVPLSEPLSAAILTGTEGNSDTVPATADTTTALSTTFASASTIVLISVDDYEVMGTDDQAGADGNAGPFPNVDDVELTIP
ncbi:hypothetical protein Tco_0265208 [Tanacetum coccineum]